MNGICRKAWVIIAEHQLQRRLKIFGEQANTCKGCQEILICSGPVSFELCNAVDEMIANGLITGPKKIYPFHKTRRKFLPIDDECLGKYKITKQELSC